MGDSQLSVQLEARELLPFNLAKQNLLLASLDCIGLNNLLGVGWLDVTSVTQAWHWNTSRVDDMGTANITMVTMRDKVRSSMGEVSFFLCHISSQARQTTQG